MIKDKKRKGRHFFGGEEALLTGKNIYTPEKELNDGYCFDFFLW